MIAKWKYWAGTSYPLIFFITSVLFLQCYIYFHCSNIYIWREILPVVSFYDWFRCVILILWNLSKHHSWYNTRWITHIIFLRGIIFIYTWFSLCHTTSWRRDTFLFINFHRWLSLNIIFFVQKQPLWPLYPLEHYSHLYQNERFVYSVPYLLSFQIYLH